MNPFRGRRIFSISTFRRDSRAQVDEELALHLEARTQEFIDNGWSPHAARAEAERLFGDYEAIRDECARLTDQRQRSVSRMERLGGWVQDLRFALRQLRRNPAFAFIAILTLGLGLGATTTIFSVVNGVLLRPLPFAEPDELIRVWVGEGRGAMSGLDMVDVQNQVASIDRMIGVTTGQYTITGQGEPFIIPTGRVTEGVFSLFRVAPQLGRDLGLASVPADVKSEVVLADATWRRVFGADPEVIGSTLDVNGVAYEIIGVGPAGFAFPDGVGMWVSRPIANEGCERGCHTWRTVGTLAEGASLARVQAELDGLGVSLEQTYPDTNTNKRFRVLTLQDDLVGDVRRGLWILLGAVGAVLLIACANVANLLLVRSTARTGEMAVRGALGATRGRLVRQGLIESGVLAVAGGLVGLGLAHLGIRAVRLFADQSIPRVDTVGLDLQAALFALALVAGVTALFGLSPLAQNARLGLQQSLGGSGRGGVGGSGAQRRLLVAAEMGLSVVLLVAAGLLLRTFSQLYSVELGYVTEDVTRFTVSLPSARYETLDEVRTFYRTLEDQLAQLPGVESVGSAFGAPFVRSRITGDLLVEGRPEPEPGQEIEASLKAVSPHYLETMRISLVSGRTLEPSDDVEGIPVAVVSETLAREAFPGQDPIGERVRVTVDMGYGSPLWTIVGVAADVRSRSITTEPVAEIYVPQGHFGPASLTTSLRTAPGVPISADMIRREVASLDPNLPIRGFETIADAIADDVAPTRFYLFLVASFAALALLLAAIGLYGVLSYSVSSRTREIGVRLALGAEQKKITRMVVFDGLKPALGGAVIGLLIALAAGRVLESILYGVQPRDLVVLTTVPGVLFAVAILAALVPALRAGKLDPSEALRSDL